jgi:hypothetical protein
VANIRIQNPQYSLEKPEHDLILDLRFKSILLNEHEIFYAMGTTAPQMAADGKPEPEPDTKRELQTKF